jgi:hypothetical protein
MLLLSAGWKEKQIAAAMSEQGLDMPVPRPPDTGGAREAFLHLLAFAAFYASVVAVIVLFFQYIDELLPDPALPTWRGGEAWRLQAIRWWMASLIVAFPASLWLSGFLLRELRAQPEKAWSPLRRWLTYLTLFAAAITGGVDGITLVFKLLEGELSLRFILKVTAVLFVAGSAFTYCTLSLRWPVGDPRAARMHRSFAAGAAVVVVAALVSGIAIAGLPGTERLRKLDERRLDDLRAIEREIRVLCVEESRGGAAPVLKKPLPGTLDELLAQAVSERPDVRDPQTGEPYGYEVLGESRYRLCASFNRQRDKDFDVSWNHPAGRHCFEVDALERPPP